MCLAEHQVMWEFRDAQFDIWGGGPRLKLFVVEIDEKYVDQKKHQMVTYIIGKAYAKNLFNET